MDLWRAVVLGLVEGLTEFLPVSSTGHLLVTQRLLGIEASAAANTYAIAIQGGAIAAVLVLYRQRLLQMLRGVLGRDAEGLHLALALVVAFVPAAIAGLAFDELIEGYLFGPIPVAIAWAVGGVLMLAVSSRLQPGGVAPRSRRVVVGLRDRALPVCRAVAGRESQPRDDPGWVSRWACRCRPRWSSRSSSGCSRSALRRRYKALDSGGVMLAAYGPTVVTAGFVAAWLSAMLSVTWMVGWLQHRRLAVFGWWRIAAAAVWCSCSSL